jgi:hypothetical protein
MFVGFGIACVIFLLLVYFAQALDVIRELQKHFPIKRSPMRLGLTVSGQNFSTLLEKLGAWDANVVSKDESGSRQSIVSFTHSFVV